MKTIIFGNDSATITLIERTLVDFTTDVHTLCSNKSEDLIDFFNIVENVDAVIFAGLAKNAEIYFSVKNGAKVLLLLTTMPPIRDPNIIIGNLAGIIDDEILEKNIKDLIKLVQEDKSKEILSCG